VVLLAFYGVLVFIRTGLNIFRYWWPLVWIGGTLFTVSGVLIDE